MIMLTDRFQLFQFDWNINALIAEIFNAIHRLMNKDDSVSIIYNLNRYYPEGGQTGNVTIKSRGIDCPVKSILFVQVPRTNVKVRSDGYCLSRCLYNLPLFRFKGHQPVLKTKMMAMKYNYTAQNLATNPHRSKTFSFYCKIHNDR